MADDLGNFPVLVAGDHEIFSECLVLSLRQRGIEARKIPTSRLHLGGHQPSCRAGLMILDIRRVRDFTTTAIGGAGTVADLVASGWRVLVLSAANDTSGAAGTRGAVNFMARSDSFDSLLTAISSAAGQPQ